MTHTPKHEATDAMGMERQRNDPNPLSGKSGELKPSPSEVTEVALEIRDLLGRKKLTSQHYDMAEAVIGAYERVRHEPRATTQPAEQSDGHPRDEQGRTAFEIIADANHEAAMVRAGIKDRSRDPLLGPPSDMVVSRVLLGEREDMSPKEADALAVKINDALSSLAAEQSASSPVEKLREALFECQDKLWVARCDSRDEGFRKAAERAVDMASEALKSTRSVAVSAEAVVALEPFALLVGYGDPANATVNMDDPISKWLTVAQLQDAARVMNSLLNQARKPEGGGDA